SGRGLTRWLDGQEHQRDVRGGWDQAGSHLRGMLAPVGRAKTHFVAPEKRGGGEDALQTLAQSRICEVSRTEGSEGAAHRLLRAQLQCRQKGVVGPDDAQPSIDDEKRMADCAEESRGI